MRLCVLGSGSSGNCIYVASGATGLLVDAGLSGREIIRRLEMVGIKPSDISAVCLTHEHSDHIDGLLGLLRVSNPLLYANSETIRAVEQALERAGLPWQAFATGFKFPVGEIEVEPFTVCHDALDPVGFVFSAGGTRIGVVTDIGCSTTLVREKLHDCTVVVLESNHDEKKLRDSRRPWALKQRIAGRHGHLSNTGAAELIASIAGHGLRRVYLAHISAECNDPGIADKAVRRELEKAGIHDVEVLAASADEPSEMWESG